MGVDEALLATAATGSATLRLYSWDGPWLSLGYGQRCGDELVRACRSAGVGLVRRATGGRAVLHGADLTYAVAAPEAALPPGLRGSYEKVADLLLAALAAVGVASAKSATASASAATPGSAGSGPGRSHGLDGSDGFDCFEVAAADEICLGGSKLAGSAQRRAGGAVLQHGSIRLQADPTAAARAVGLLGAGATSLRESGHPVSERDLRAALIEAFPGVFRVALVPEALSCEEESLARARVRQHRRDPLTRPQLPV